MSTNKTLPQPDTAARAASAELHERLCTAIDAAGGAIPFDCFMERALYEPQLGYYRGGAARFGSGGDFATAPELTPLFGRTLAHQIAEILAHLGGGEVIELGPGSGRLAADTLTELAALDALPQRWRMLEVSGALRAEQERTLAACDAAIGARIEWLEALPEPTGNRIWVANEVLDALPVKRFVRRDGAIRELGVGVEEGRLVWRELPAAEELRAAVERLEEGMAPFPDGYVSEVCTRLPAFIRGLAEAFERGVMLWIDYGYPRREYYLPERRRGTLICHYRHHAHDDPFFYPGLQDITAFVDFSALAEALRAAELDVLGYAPQGPFLVGAGLAELARPQLETIEDARERVVIAQAIHRLTHPGDMGERFKVMVAGRGYSGPLSGLRIADRLGSL
ncbi:SAM-dependent methyltransferase [Halorhodospira abdelmalekii]|uniref:class I SAM-dependent methyltransferase n=1 Tax=Halorhodospira abdelmalekii TaxID=421629 RepID=UPI001907641F|nr:SAM-dependent methyltransferase [Halorhodospira abdelmalekii]MBK1734390.1 SAM-dependent methyltransferase [Halorhodospira abdelmalekii]